jgi:predicted XRE-type DNA-binding protein
MSQRKVRPGTSNIFADLGLADSETHLLKAKLVAELYRLVKAGALTQTAAGVLMGISQPEVSRLFKGHFREYSIERLMAFLTNFDRDIEIIVRRRPARSRGKIIFRPEAA